MIKKPSVPPCETFYTFHTVLDLTEFTKNTEGESRKSVKKPLCEILPLTEITKDTKRGSVKALKNLCALRTSVRNFLYLPCRFRSHGDHKETGNINRRGCRVTQRETSMELNTITERITGCAIR